MAFHHEERSGGGSVSSIMNNNSSERKFTKLFVGGLAWETKSESLHRYFEEFGDIEEAVVIYDRRTGRSKGYGFVTFKDQEAARRACANPNPVIDGREANCNIASLGRRPHQPLSPFGNMVPTTQGSPVISSPHTGGGPLYPLPLAYGYQPGYYYPSYRPMMYGPGYLYPQVYAPPSSKKMPDDPISPYGYASTGGYLLPSPNAIHSPGPSFGEPMQYSPGAFVPSLRQPPVLSMPPTGNHHQVNKESASDQVA